MALADPILLHPDPVLRVLGGGCYSLESLPASPPPPGARPPPRAWGGKHVLRGSKLNNHQFSDDALGWEYKSLSSCLAHLPAPEAGERVVTRGVLGLSLRSVQRGTQLTFTRARLHLHPAPLKAH